MDNGTLNQPRYTLTDDGNSFTADGVTYTGIEPDALSIARYKVFMKRQVEYGFNGTFKGICNDLDAAWAALEKGQMGTSSKLIGNLRDGITFAGHGRVVGLELCGLFFNAPEEDAATYDHQAMLAKLQAWEDAGLPIGFFFQQSARYVSGFYERFTLSSPPATTASEPPTPLPGA